MIDPTDTYPVQNIKERIGWLEERYKTVAENVANAQDPNYQTKDITDFKFGYKPRQINLSKPVKVELEMNKASQIRLDYSLAISAYSKYMNMIKNYITGLK